MLLSMYVCGGGGVVVGAVVVVVVVVVWWWLCWLLRNCEASVCLS
jgi:hypothetical protein